jgi:hypothetical protein
MAVEVLAGSVVAHGGSRVGVAGGDLHVAEADAGVEPGTEQCSNPANICRSRAIRRRHSSCWRRPKAKAIVEAGRRQTALYRSLSRAGSRSRLRAQALRLLAPPRAPPFLDAGLAP